MVQIENICRLHTCNKCVSKIEICLEKCGKHCLTHYQTTNFRFFQTERVCRRQFHFDENGRKLSKWVENTVGKGEIARYEQFLLFPHCFQKACFPGASKGVIVWEWVKKVKMLVSSILSFFHNGFNRLLSQGPEKFRILL